MATTLLIGLAAFLPGVFTDALHALNLLGTKTETLWMFKLMLLGVLSFVTFFNRQYSPTMIFGPESLWILWVAGLVGGVIGALLAIFFQNLAIVVGGFLAGSLVVFHLMQHVGMAPHALIVLAGGALGALALFLIFDWALILLSSMVGATMITEVAGLQLPAVPIVFIVSCAIGVAVQGGWLLAVRKREH